MKPICVKCRRFYRAKKNGVRFEEGMPLTNDIEGPWGPYKLWVGDLFSCPDCNIEIIAGFGRNPLAEHYQPNYQQQRTELAPIYPGRCR